MFRKQNLKKISNITFLTHIRDPILGHLVRGQSGGRKGVTKVFKHRRKSPWVPTLTGPFPNGQANVGS